MILLGENLDISQIMERENFGPMVNFGLRMNFGPMVNFEPSVNFELEFGFLTEGIIVTYYEFCT